MINPIRLLGELQRLAGFIQQGEGDAREGFPGEAVHLGQDHAKGFVHRLDVGDLRKGEGIAAQLCESFGIGFMDGILTGRKVEDGGLAFRIHGESFHTLVVRPVGAVLVLGEQYWVPVSIRKPEGDAGHGFLGQAIGLYHIDPSGGVFYVHRTVPCQIDAGGAHAHISPMGRGDLGQGVAAPGQAADICPATAGGEGVGAAAGGILPRAGFGKADGVAALGKLEHRAIQGRVGISIRLSYRQVEKPAGDVHIAAIRRAACGHLYRNDPLPAAGGFRFIPVQQGAFAR